MKTKKENKPKFSSAEKKAYYIGIGAAIGLGKFAHIKRYMSNLSALEKQSFKNGFDDRLLKR